MVVVSGLRAPAVRQIARPAADSNSRALGATFE
jgi:hypothetical protein